MFTFTLPTTPRLTQVSMLATALLLGACNDKDALRTGGGHDHDENPAGRLVFGHANGASSQAVVYDLESRTFTNLSLGYNPTAVYASPGKAYAVIFQSGDAQVSFVDGGIHAHGDHVHVDPPALLDFTLSGVKPSHYQVHEDQAVVYFDGEGATPASFSLLTDLSIGSLSAVASQTMPAPLHGVGEPRDGYVLVYDNRVEEGNTGAVRPYEIHGDHFHGEDRLPTECGQLHGAGSNEHYSAFGCTDGVLVVEQDDDSFTEFKIATDKRITQIAGHHAAAVFAAFASDGSMYVIDPVAKTASAYDWNGAETDVNRRQHSFDAHGERLLILDRTGTLHVLGVHGDHFHRDGTVKLLADDHASARIATSAAADHAYVTDPANNAVFVVDLDHVEEIDHIALSFSPVGVTWLGVAAEAGEPHDHDHPH